MYSILNKKALTCVVCRDAGRTWKLDLAPQTKMHDALEQKKGQQKFSGKFTKSPHHSRGNAQNSASKIISGFLLMEWDTVV